MSRVAIPLTVVARNEERAIGPCLDALLGAVRRAEAARHVRIDPLVVLDDCHDRTEDEVRARGVAVRRSSGGKVEGQRAGLRPGPFQLFSDADIQVSDDALLALVEAMDAPEVVVAVPRKRPLPPRRRTPLAWALHRYNLRGGYASRQAWFNGKLFAIRRWDVPTLAQLAPRLARLPDDGFYDLGAGMRVDDVYLSRAVVAAHGPEAIRVTAGTVSYRAPETFEGMYRYYRRMRRELERVDLLFPETRDVHRRHGARSMDLLDRASLAERAAHHLFSAALLACRVRYRLERFAYQRLARTPLDPWPPVEETKCL